MYSKEEAFQIKKKFWRSLGQYMSLQPASGEGKVNWLNYKTGIKDLYFRVEVDNRSASIFIEISQKDIETQREIYDKFKMFETILFTYLQEEWVWNFGFYDEHGKRITTIGTTIKNVSIFRETDWSKIISFVKDRLLALDSFWDTYKEAFELE